MSKPSSLKFVRHPHPSPTPADKRAELLKNPGFDPAKDFIPVAGNSRLLTICSIAITMINAP